MRHRRHHAALHQAQLSREGRERAEPRPARGVLRRAHRPPGPVVVDIPKDIQFAKGIYTGLTNSQHKSYRPQIDGDERAVAAAVDLIANAKRPIFYTGGGIINSGPKASKRLREFVRMTGYPITSTLMGLGAYPASDKQWLGMLGMHGTYEANNAMHDCDVMICIGARFDDRITGRVDAFSPARRRSTSISTAPRSTRTCMSTSRSSAIAVACSSR